MGFLAITQPVFNEGTLYLIGDLDIDWLFDSPGIIEVHGNFFNDDEVNIGGGGLIRVNGNFMNDGIITGGGAICVSGITVNAGDLVGSLDFCDETPTVSVPPFIDTNTGAVDQGIIYCASEKCSVGIGEDSFAVLVVAPNPANDQVTFEGMPAGCGTPDLRWLGATGACAGCSVRHEDHRGTQRPGERHLLRHGYEGDAAEYHSLGGGVITSLPTCAPPPARPRDPSRRSPEHCPWGRSW